FGRQEADHARDAVAVELQRLEIRVAVAIEVHFHAGDDLVKPLFRKIEAGEQGGEGARDRVLGLAAVHGRDLVAPPRELGAGDGGVRAVVHDVVDLAAEGVEGGDAAPFFLGQKEEAVIEARAARRGFLAAVLVGRHRWVRRDWYGVTGTARRVRRDGCGVQ